MYIRIGFILFFVVVDALLYLFKIQEKEVKKDICRLTHRKPKPCKDYRELPVSQFSQVET